jgi:hypothetical protein
MDVSGALMVLANWLKPLGSGASQAWEAIPADWRVPAAAGFLVAAIAAVVRVLNYRRTYARLDISVMADPFGQKFGDLADECCACGSSVGYWQITSRCGGPSPGRPPPDGVHVAYALGTGA